MDYRTVTLESLGNGAAAELFAIELQKVIENINDFNTKAEAVRSITIKVLIKPNEQRDSAMVGIQVESKLESIKPFGTVFFFGVKDGQMQVVESTATEQALPFGDNIVKAAAGGSK